MTDTILRFVHISDTHISANSEYGRGSWESPRSTREGTEALVRQLNTLPFEPDFILHTGDVAYDPDPSAYEAAREILGQIRYPVHYVAGNHDYPSELQRSMAGRREILASFYHTFEVNGVQIVVLDSNGPAEPPRGFVPEEQLAWLENICKSDDPRPLIVAVHHHLLPVGIPWMDEFMRTTNGEAVHRALIPARDRLRGVFFGHIHQNVDMYRNGILYASTLSSWVQFHGWPGQDKTIADMDSNPGFNIVTLTHDQTYIRRCRFHL
jgi:3',5'-cyclic-AMP phosphodiesterase